jgi:formamidopyrimidine-DNA glycosylase
MPELPEVETIVRGLQQYIPGKTIQSIEIRHPKPVRACGEAGFRRFLSNKTVQSVQRQGKFIHFRFTTGESLVVHLRMTGKFIFSAGPAAADDPHIRLVFHFTDRSLLCYKDLRIFGTFRIFHKDEPIREFIKLGRDPIREQITTRWFLGQCKKRSIAIKTLLLDQNVICGLGNIYACEALFRARISPFLPTKKLREDQARTLLKNIRSLLLLAIRHNGTSIKDFKNVDDKSGSFQRLLKVYGREGQPCCACRVTTIQRARQAQRSTFYCPRCQK